MARLEPESLEEVMTLGASLCVLRGLQCHLLLGVEALHPLLCVSLQSLEALHPLLCVSLQSLAARPRVSPPLGQSQ